jgi:hypothetical protein
VKLGTENRKKTIWAAVLGVIAVLAVGYQVLPFLWSPSSTPDSSAQAAAPTAAPARPAARPSARPVARTGKKVSPGDNLDPTLQLQLLARSEQMKYAGSGRNIFVSQAEDVVIPKPRAPGVVGGPQNIIYTPPPVPQAPPIPLKFFGFASGPGEPKRIFLSKDQDVFIAGEGEIVDRRYKVVHISPNSVDIQDLVVSGPPQTIQLTTS